MRHPMGVVSRVEIVIGRMVVSEMGSQGTPSIVHQYPPLTNRAAWSMCVWGGGNLSCCGRVSCRARGPQPLPAARSPSPPTTGPGGRGDGPAAPPSGASTWLQLACLYAQPAAHRFSRTSEISNEYFATSDFCPTLLVMCHPLENSDHPFIVPKNSSMLAFHPVTVCSACKDRYEGMVSIRAGVGGGEGQLPCGSRRRRQRAARKALGRENAVRTILPRGDAPSDHSKASDPRGTCFAPPPTPPH